MKYDRPHVLVITHVPGDDQYDPDAEYELIHPDDCPTETYALDPDNIPILSHTCMTGTDVAYAGLDGLGWEKDAVPGWEKPEWALPWEEWKGLPEGRYIIRSYGFYDSFYGEWDGGIELLGLEGEVEVAT